MIQIFLSFDYTHASTINDATSYTVSLVLVKKVLLLLKIWPFITNFSHIFGNFVSFGVLKSFRYRLLCSGIPHSICRYQQTLTLRKNRYLHFQCTKTSSQGRRVGRDKVSRMRYLLLFCTENGGSRSSKTLVILSSDLCDAESKSPSQTRCNVQATSNIQFLLKDFIHYFKELQKNNKKLGKWEDICKYPACQYLACQYPAYQYLA